MPWFFIEKIRAFTIWKIKILPLFLRWAHSKIPLRLGVIEKNPKLPCFGIYATTCFSKENTCKINSLTNSSRCLHIIFWLPLVVTCLVHHGCLQMIFIFKFAPYMYVPYKHMISLLCVDSILHYSNMSIEPSKKLWFTYTAIIFYDWLYILYIFHVLLFWLFLFRLIEAYAYGSAHWPVQDLYA